jgi:hypothetical protein
LPRPRHGGGGDSMEVLYLIVVLAGWFALNRWILPRLGIQT